MAVTACGSVVAPEVSNDGVVDQSELTRPLQSGVARKTYGDAAQVRSYTIKVDTNGSTLAVDLTGTGNAKLKVSSADGSQTCLRTAAALDHHCSFTAPGAGTWTFDITGVTAFSGSLVVSIGYGSDPTVDAGVPSTGHGPLPGGAMLSVHTTMGLPAAAAIGDVNHWLLLKDQYVVSYDSVHKVPNWVSWQMNAKWIGTATRSPSFNPDPQLPNTVGQGKNSDFDGTAYARGHMCPSGDRTDSQANNLSTFVFTNVVPQAPTSNNGPWKGLENEERQLAALGKTLFITAGPIFGANASTIGDGISVPVATFKVVVVLDSATATAASVTDTTQVIAVIMPNDTTATKVWTEYRTTVRDIEAKTGLDLLSDLATATQDVVETRVDATPPQ